MRGVQFEKQVFIAICAVGGSGGMEAAVKNSALYVLAVFVAFMSLSGLLERYSAAKSAILTRYLITSAGILVSADTCLCLAGMGFLLDSFSSGVQWFMKTLLGLVLLNRNERLDYAFALVMLFFLYLAFYYAETRLRPQESKVVCINSINFEKVKSARSNPFFVINIVCAAITAFTAIYTFFSGLLA